MHECAYVSVCVSVCVCVHACVSVSIHSVSVCLRMCISVCSHIDPAMSVCVKLSALVDKRRSLCVCVSVFGHACVSVRICVRRGGGGGTHIHWSTVKSDAACWTRQIPVSQCRTGRELQFARLVRPPTKHKS